MTQDEVIEIVRQAQVHEELTGEHFIYEFAKLVEDAAFKRWAAQTKLAVQDEREACAKVCEPQEEHDDPLTAWKIASAIRARGEA